jgi:adsorption protein B
MSLFLLAIAITLITALVLHLDDLLFDALWIFFRAKPKTIGTARESHWRQLPQRRMAILIPCWQSADHLEQMVRGNVLHTAYENYTIFLGVYQDDAATLQVANRLVGENIRLLTFPKGTHHNKAKLCNEMLRAAYTQNQTARKYEAFFVTDSDEIWHPLTLVYANAELETSPLLQIPVLANLEGKSTLALSTYADELAEHLARDIPLRSALNAYPSPFMGGVILQRTLLTTLLSTPAVFSENLLAEAYQLARKSTLLGFRVKSDSLWLESSRNFLANRKFFPENVAAAVAQKSRITLGTSFQNIGGIFEQSWARTYTLWRDRRGPWTTLFLALASLLVVLSLVQNAETPPLLPPWMETISFANFFFWLRRIFVRMYCTNLVYGWRHSFGVILRWPVGNFINSLSAWRALSHRRKMYFGREVPHWIPREKRIPKEYLFLQT